MTPEEFAKSIDYSILRPNATIADIDRAVETTLKYKFAGICVNPCYIDHVKNKMKDATSKIVSVVSFPFGADTLLSKVMLIEDSLRRGADEVDVVYNLGVYKSGRDDYTKKEIRTIVDKVRRFEMESGTGTKIVKIIIETGQLTETEKYKAAMMVKEAGADFVKTSTGYIGQGVTLEDVENIRKWVGPDLGIKASGGVKDWLEAHRYLLAGATRLGTSHAVEIVEQYKEERRMVKEQSRSGAGQAKG